MQEAKKLAANVLCPAETCVVAGGPRDKIIKLATEIKPGYIQLHGGESLGDTAFLAEKLKKIGVKIIKAVFPNTPDLKKAAADFCKAGVYALLFDPRTPENAAAGGIADTDMFVTLKNAVNCPVIIAGGINPENAADIIQKTKAQIIDLMTGVEKAPGVKDEKKVKLLFEKIGREQKSDRQ